MSLLKPTLGEKLDRMTILELKLDNGGGQHFQDELDEIRRNVFLDSLDEKPAKSMGKLAKDLAKVNKELWLVVDRQRAFLYDEEADEEKEGYALLEHLYDLNQKRRQIIEKIDKLSGEFRGKEKL